MNERSLSRADLQWLREALSICREKLEDYPEIFSDEDEDTLKVAEEILHE